ncbi:MAG TPA: efflux RND transporter periplasmic adaptor subunit [Bryobacteraceae bacterium]|jgi:RND family efflux transporter MFP subunit|nr:efflux RND transporter periplasmic adaptor subunit [Bryobacteraceae bacterium]
MKVQEEPLETHQTTPAPAGPSDRSNNDKRQRHGVGPAFILLLVIALAAVGWFVYRGINSRVSAEKALVEETKESAVLTVAITHPKVANAGNDLVLPGNTQPLMDAPVYARTSGYLRKWYADIGSKVHAGDLLAEIETPETDQQLQQARSDVETAETNYKLAQITAGRYTNLLQKGAVARQDTDNAVADMNSKKSIVDSARANVKRLEDLQGYEKVYAPFDGVITARNTDVGALINAGAASAGTPASGNGLFHLSATDKLRVFVNVPEEYERAAANGSTASLTLAEFPGRTFTGTIVRNSSSIDPASRTLLVEVDVNNEKGELLPGAYVSVHLNLTGSGTAGMTIPINTVLFRSEGLRAAVVRDGRAMLVPVQVGRDFGDSLEVVAGLRRNEDMIVNPPDSLVSGTPVRIANNK